MNSSRINLNEIISQLPPWNLVLTVDGVDYPIRELRISDLSKLQPSALTNTKELLALVESLFEGNRPEIGNWSLDALAIVIGRMTAYSRERSEKNSHMAGRIAPAASVQA